SGVGREMGEAGLAEYTEIKRVHVSSGGDRSSRRAFEMMLEMPESENFSFHAPTKVKAGPLAISAISHEAALLGCRRVLLLTDPGVRNAGLADVVARALGDVLAGQFDDIPVDTSLDTVDRAARHARQQGVDGVVSVGGGSVIDTGKVLAVVLREGGHAIDHIGIDRLKRHQTPHLVVPTTCGTGSEVTNVAVVKNPEAGRKAYLMDPYVFPDVAILDPQFVAGLPGPMVASTAMDALTHAIEAVMSRLSNDVCTGHALQAVRLIAAHLPEAVKNPQNTRARGKLQTAAALAGWAFTVAQVGLAHAVAHSLGALLEVPHGIACGIMLPHVMRYNSEYAEEGLSRVAQALGVETSDTSQSSPALAAADQIRVLMEQIDHPMSLSAMGVDKDRFMDIAVHAVADPAVMFNPRPPGGPAGIMEILEAAR
ncbi:MAG: iron-containing alcohol dehydrogenase, partial [Desulfosalsimonas sp.]